MKTALVTGGAKGLGKEFVKALCKNGYHVLIHYHKSQKEAEQLVSSLNQKAMSAETCYGDFSSLEGVQAFTQSLPKDLYALVNNVGNYHTNSLLKTEETDFLDLFFTNVYAPFALIRSFEKALIRSKGVVLNLGCAGCSLSKVNAYIPAYHIMKHQLLKLTQTFAKEFAKHGVRVNMISPGMLETSIDLLSKVSTTPQKKPIELREIISCALYLLSDDSSSVTGQNVEVAGGYCL